MKLLDPGPLGILHVLSSGGERDGRGPVFGAVLEVLDVYHAGCSLRLSDSIYCR